MCHALLAEVSGLTVQVLISLAVIVALGILLGVVAMALRKRLLSDGDDPAAGPVGFSLSDLRRLHAAGQLSDEELAQAEAKMLAKSRSHYLGEDAGTAPTAAGPQDAINGASTSDPPPDDDVAENPGADTDKNGGGWPAG